MAQAARLSSRMHKELKLLLSDPPPGATFPSLSDSSASLTAIDAQIEGPKGTVYENGYFHIRIHIPERYPFQPPVVTFATPIYHPNIDTGGRICLDILNLPPKGAWQPSLNISTVITSIGLLLSEPNPDDGLMREASTEYKYNRQVFDQKARSMTEKYAKASSRGNCGSSCNEEFLVSSNSSQGDGEGIKNEVRSEASHLKLHSLSRKLSLQSSGSSKNSNDKRVADQPNITPPNCQMETVHRLVSKQNPCYTSGNDGRLSEMRRKLSLEASCQSLKRSDETNKTSLDVGGSGLSCQDVGLGAKPPVCPKFTADCSNKMEHVKSNKIQQAIQPASTGSCLNLPKISSLKSLDVDCGELKPPVEDKYLVESNLTMPRLSYEHQLSNRKLNLGCRESEEKTKENNKENIPQVALHKPTPEPSYQPCELHLVSSSLAGKHVSGRILNPKPISSNQDQGVRKRLSLRARKSSLANRESNAEVNNAPNKCTGQQVGGESEPPISSEAIVLDSEDEEERDEPRNSKVIVARRRLSLVGKRKAKE